MIQRLITHFFLFQLMLVNLLAAGCSRGPESAQKKAQDAYTKQLADLKPPKFPQADAPAGYLTPLPKGLPQDFGKSTELDELYPIPQNPAIQDANAKRRRAIQRKVTLEVFEKHGRRDAPWTHLASTALEKTLDAISSPPSYASAAIFERDSAIQSAIDAGCDDLTIRYFHWLWIRNPTHSDAKLDADIQAYADQFEREKYPIIRRIHARWNACTSATKKIPFPEKPIPPARTTLRQPNRKRVNVLPAFEPIWPLLTELSQERSEVSDLLLVGYAKDLFDMYDLSGVDLKECYDRFVKCLGDGKASPWVLKTVEANFYLDYAWDARGNSFADKVPEEAWPIFRERLNLAEAAAKEAWDLDQTRAEPANLMLIVAKAFSYPRDKMEVWFRRAMTADPGNYKACTSKLDYLHPKWGGSYEEMIAFARQCVRTQNWNANLPMVLYFVHTIDSENRELTELSRPDIWADIREIFEPRIVSHPGDRFAITLYGKLAQLNGKPDLAFYLFDLLKGEPSLSTMTYQSKARFEEVLGFTRAEYLMRYGSKKN